MRQQFCLLILFFSTVLIAQNQPEHFIQFKQHTQFVKSIPVENKAQILLGISSRPISAMPVLAKYDSTGQLLWSTLLPELEQETIYSADIIPAQDGDFILLLNGSGCDFGTPLVIARITSSNQILWQKYLDIPADYSGKSTFLFPVSSDLFAISSKNDRVIIDGNGDVNSQTIVNFKVNGYIPYQSGYVIWSGDQLSKASSCLDFDQPISFSDDIQQVIATDDNCFLVLTNNTLYKTDLNFNILSTQTAFLSLTTKKAILNFAGKYWIAGHSNDETGILVRLNADLQAEQQIPFGELNKLVGISSTANDLLVIGQQGGFFTKVVSPVATSVQINQDLTITDIRFAEASVASAPFYCSSTLGLTHKINFGAIYVTVQNNGITAIDSLRINFEHPVCYGICYDLFQRSHHYSNIDLQPGTSIELFFDSLTFIPNDNSLMQTLCFNVSAPNNRIDRLPVNNEYCQEITATVATNSPESLPDWISVYPIPALDWVQIQLADRNNAAIFRLYDFTGKMQQQINIPNGDIRIEKRNLPAGYYFFSIEQGGRFGFGKLGFE